MFQLSLETLCFYCLILNEEDTYMYDDNPKAKECVHGLVNINRWEKGDKLFCSDFSAPAIFVAYNVFMNGVDRFDQVRNVNPCQRKEQRVSMSLFTWCLDVACNNTQSVLRSLYPHKQWNLFDLKHRIALDLTQPYVDWKNKNKSARSTKVSPRKRKDPPEAVCELADKPYYLLKSKDDKYHTCFLCRKVSSKRLRTMFSCVECKKGFHVECFSLFHFKHTLPDDY